jgi:hypothetical protein
MRALDCTQNSHRLCAAAVQVHRTTTMRRGSDALIWILLGNMVSAVVSKGHHKQGGHRGHGNTHGNTHIHGNTHGNIHTATHGTVPGLLGMRELHDLHNPEDGNVIGKDSRGKWTWEDNHRVVTGNGHRWCKLQRDNWSCVGERYA